MTDAIDAYFWPTPNGWKLTIALEEMELPYRLHLIDIDHGAQHAPAFQKISPNGRIPAIVDPDGPGGEPVSIFESGAILLYLGRKTGRFLGTSERERLRVLEWLMWQMGGLGPMAGQAHHFLRVVPRARPELDATYSQDRYRAETARLYAVLDRQLAHHEFIAGDFLSVADFAAWPWASQWIRQEQVLEEMPHVARWLRQLGARPALRRGRLLHAELRKENAAELAYRREILGG
ncbi:glutathione S-transferase N-terminal domain-containing protein [Albidovulum sediminicola]|uniref:Glutathione S-transferase N-terminal domain-containing protein n=1 Tax=Albidovulum sediminicola TaxID=2984331 RepID=A0ABT2Z267_9RHOB|nr:glutathione S-transferase N-terminal domain-containing protein [Defluviimonas sp. WL0075]MCV2865190.1 glutathione S-transferase N-terminal domain-containing protein [Defluviimonas sp. WL0075]